MYLLRGFATWLIIILAETVHGILREALLAPMVGSFTARRVAFYIGLGLIFAVSMVFIRWINAQTVRQLLVVGAMWMILTLLFELGLGLLLGLSSERILEDYDVTRGGLMAFGMLFLLVAPLLASRIRNAYVRTSE
ncbi:MAG: hypothetical protein IPM50_14770 [Acidobacteriota bacterium]|nr:MAG: hypothetical protein IPM50_14770 [Acidobacteriota bacterium]